MIKVPISISKNLSQTINYFFLLLIFALPFVSYPFVLNSNKTGKELYLVIVVSLFLVFQILGFIKNKTIKIYSVDLMMLLFLIYVIVHYFLFSSYSFLYDQFWVFNGYILLFYLFRWTYSRNLEKKMIFNATVYIVWFYCFIQSIIAIFQNFEIIDSGNEYFKTVGTFINPNFLGVYMVISLIFLSYKIVVINEKRVVSKLAILISSTSIIYVLYLTKSRASWISLFVGLLILFLTSPQRVLFLKANKKKALILLTSICVFITVCLSMLYQLNKNSVDGRALIRKITISDIQEKPLFGNGIFNFPSIYNNSKANYFNEMQRPWEEIKVADYVSVALNDYIQIVFEIGFVGLILMILILIVVIRKIEINDRARLALTVIGTFAFLGLFTSVLYNPTAMVFFVWALSVLFVYGNNKIEVFVVSNNSFITILKSFFIFIFLGIIVLFSFKTKSLMDFKTVVQDLNKKFYYKLSDNDMLLIKDDAFTEFKLGIESYYDNNESVGLYMMENSVKKSRNPDANIALANIYNSRKDFKKEEKILLLNKGIESFRFEPRVKLLHFYIKTHQKIKSRKIANEIINLRVKIKSKEVEMIKSEAMRYLRLE
nr:O-antigen ligase family protein [uncultured Flavobacterium sp.]